VKYRLKWWNRQHFGNVFHAKQSTQAHLDSITRKICDRGLTEDLGLLEATTVKQFEEWELHEEMFWKKKSRIKWLQVRDMNTSFFHNLVKDRRQGNVISSLKSSNREILSSSTSTSTEAIHFFSILLSEDSLPTEEDETNIMNSIPPLVTNEMNASLLNPISLLEIETFVFQMKNGKDTEPNAFPVEFYQDF